MRNWKTGRGWIDLCPCVIAALLFLFLLAGSAPVSAQGGEVSFGTPGDPGSDGLELHVMGYRFTGNTVFSDEELAEHLANSIGKELTLPHLEEAASRITRLYRDRGSKWTPMSRHKIRSA